MSDQKKDSKRDNNFDEVKAAYKSLSDMRGECPSSEDLVRYQQRSLSTEEMLLIKQHLNLCGLCDWAITELAEFDSVPIPAPQEERHPKRTRSPLRLFLNPALAFALFFLLLVPIYYFYQSKATHLATNGVGSAKDFDLGVASTTRSASTAEKKLVIVSHYERFFILNFFITIRTNHLYQMEILDQKGGKIDSEEIHSRDSLGNFSIVCNSKLFPDGDYSLIVKEVAQTRQIKDEYRFLFQVQWQQ